MFNSDQEKFWAETYAKDYITKNSQFDHEKGAEAWKKMLQAIPSNEIKAYLECGCNIGRNLEQLSMVLPHASPSIVEISKPAFEYVNSRYKFQESFNGSILDAKFSRKFNLVFTMGVLIHINPDQLKDIMAKMFDHSEKYILIGEYFNRTPVSIEYQGQPDKLFKRDFGKLFLESFNVTVVDYGFLWGYVYDSAGFDDITWWLFKKK
jgi:spore coat polysaccharide biosynthesis protein SpsF